MRFRTDFFSLPTDRQDAARAWLEQHRIDPSLTPVGGMVDIDPVADEYRFAQFVRGPQGGGIRVIRGEPVVVVIRRKAVAPLPRWLVEVGRGDR